MSVSAGRRAFAWAVLGVAAFTVYGSLVPFQFRALPLAEAIDAYCSILTAKLQIVSRSDVIANVMLGIPLGFALLGLVSVDRNWPRRKVAGYGLLLLPSCVLFAALVEFSQLFTITRSCSASDIAAQSIGSAAGMVAWIFWGQWVTDRARAIWDRADLNATGRLLVAYVVLLAFIETLPFDVSASPADLYRKIRNGGVIFVPFSEFNGMTDAARWKHLGTLAKLAGLYLPVGLLATRLKGRMEKWSIVHVALAGFALAVCLESLQLVIQSRTPNVTEALVGAVAVVVGWLAGRIHREGLAIPFAVSWFIVWFAMMIPVVFPLAGTPRLETPRNFDWIPGLPLESGNPLDTLEEMLTKLVLFGLLGVLVAAWWLPPRRRRGAGGSVKVTAVIAVALGLLIAGFIENSQRWTDLHTPCITDVFLGGLGSLLGVLVASRAR